MTSDWRRTEDGGGHEEERERPPHFEWACCVWLLESQPEQADNDEEIDDLPRVPFNIQDEWVRDRRRGTDDDY